MSVRVGYGTAPGTLACSPGGQTPGGRVVRVVIDGSCYQQNDGDRMTLVVRECDRTGAPVMVMGIIEEVLASRVLLWTHDDVHYVSTSDTIGAC